MRRCFVAALIISIFCIAPSAISKSYAGEVDILLQKLVEKGILTGAEAQEIKTETQEQVKKEIAQGKYSSLPKWVQTIKLKGDMRLRYQDEVRTGSNTSQDKRSAHRDRGRFRLRLGAEAKVNDQIKAYLGFASGSDGDPRSTNQTFQDSFSKKSAWFDYAYVEYMPFNWATLFGGRMKNPIWEPGDMLWDTDINPEGGAIKFSKKLLPKVDGYLNTAFFVLDEAGANADPWMYVLQPGFKWSLTDAIKSNFAFAYYKFGQLKEATLDWSANNNARVRNGGGTFDAINPSLEISFTEPLKMIGLGSLPLVKIPYLSLFGEFVHNTNAYQSKNGYLVGVKLGDAKVSDWKQWQLKYQHVFLGTYAWPDIFPDSDRYGGRTGIVSDEIELTYGLGKNWSLGIDYYRTDLASVRDPLVDANTKVENLIQVDLNYKF